MLTRRHLQYLSSIIALILLTTQTTAQLTKEKGWIKLHDGEIIHGWIQYFHFEASPDEIKIHTPHSNSPVRKIAANNIKSLVIPAVAEFRGAIVHYYDSTGFKKKDTVLFKVLIQGHTLSLYTWEAKDQTRYYIKQIEEGGLTELLSENHQFRSQLKQFANLSPNPPKTHTLIDRSKFNPVDLHQIVGEINGEDGINFSSKYVKPGQWRWIVGTSTSIAKLAIEQHLVDTPYKFKGHELGISIGREYIKGYYIFRFELNFWRGQYRANGVDGNHSLKYSTYTPSVQVLYSLFRNQVVQVHGGAGAGLTISDYKFAEKLNTFWNNVSKRKTSLSCIVSLNAQLRYNLEVNVYYFDRSTGIDQATVDEFRPPVGCSIKFKI